MTITIPLIATNTRGQSTHAQTRARAAALAHARPRPCTRTHGQPHTRWATVELGPAWGRRLQDRPSPHARSKLTRDIDKGRCTRSTRSSLCLKASPAAVLSQPLTVDRKRTVRSQPRTRSAEAGLASSTDHCQSVCLEERLDQANGWVATDSESEVLAASICLVEPR